ncbi:TrmB family transcriptional regulator [Patescibacteria group bacterium]
MKTFLKKLGANDKEADTYLVLLELGPQPVSVVARRIGVPRSTMYVIADNLKKLHLIEKFQRGGVMFVKAVSAKDIRSVIRLREREIENLNDIYKSTLPNLESIENKLSITPVIKIYEGEDEVKKMYEIVLSEKDICSFFNPQRVKQKMPEYHFKIPETLKENQWKARELLVESPEADEYKKLYNSDFHQIKILPKNVDFQSDTIIGKDRFFQVAYGEQDIVATEIDSQSLTQTQQAVFEIMWNSI